jgi:hypothetical protein
MATATNSNAFWWALIGFFLGVACTLGAMMWLSGADDGLQGQGAPARVAALPATKPAHRAARVAPSSAGVFAPPSSLDEQVAEDAAAAGMTSRARASSPDVQ